MRFRTLAAAMLALAAGCAARAQPYRFASPLLGTADVPPPDLPGAPRPARISTKTASGKRAAPIRVAGGWQADAQQGTVRTVSARGIETTMPVASAEAADAVTHEPNARAVVWSQLPAPHRGTAPPAHDAASLARSMLAREPAELRARVGQRDKRDPYEIVLGWLAELHIDIHPPDAGGDALVTWAATAGMLAAPTDLAKPGDLLVFDHAVGDATNDLVGLVLARDGRGVTEFLYAGGGVIRRGFLDPARASSRRDVDGFVLNTFLRHGTRWPPRGTRYLSGELLSHVIHTH